MDNSLTVEMKITSFSPVSEQIFYKSAPLKQIASGYRFTEGPVWDIYDDCLYFTDFQDNLIYRWSAEDGVHIYREGSNRAVGLSMDAQGRLVSAETRSRGIAYSNNEKSTVITGTFEGKKLNSPNDVVVMRGGDICFTDPYSTAMGEPRELDFNGVFRVTPGGCAKLLYGGMPRPNGLAFSPDESILYVDDTNLQQILAFQIHEDGSASSPSTFATLDTSFGPGAADGMKVDRDGNIYLTGPGGIWVFSADASPVALLHCPEFAGNLCFGGMDSQTLFITASKSVYSLALKVPGIVSHRKKD